MVEAGRWLLILVLGYDRYVYHITGEAGDVQMEASNNYYRCIRHSQQTTNTVQENNIQHHQAIIIEGR